MQTRCMLPISIVENEGFKDYVRFPDPLFSSPSRRKIKEVGLPKLKSLVQTLVRDISKDVPWINISVDLWTDDTMRQLNSYIAQMINNNWEFDSVFGKYEFIVIIIIEEFLQ
jgi:hypothetical protein